MASCIHRIQFPKNRLVAIVVVIVALSLLSRLTFGENKYFEKTNNKNVYKKNRKQEQQRHREVFKASQQKLKEIKMFENDRINCECNKKKGNTMYVDNFLL